MNVRCYKLKLRQALVTDWKLFYKNIPQYLQHAFQFVSVTDILISVNKEGNDNFVIVVNNTMHRFNYNTTNFL